MQGVSEVSAAFMAEFMADRSRIIWIIDGNSLLYRGYYGIQQKLTGPDGKPTNAIYGVATMMRSFIREWQPRALVLTMDKHGANTVRKEVYSEYKANRAAMPPDLVVQLPGYRELFEAYGAPVLVSDRHEADDIIATIRKWAVEGEYKVVIVSGDLDLAQLFGAECVMLDPKKKEWYTHFDLPRLFSGISCATQVPMVLGLAGDPSDNIPGVPGVGEKTAGALIAQYGSIHCAIETMCEKHRLWMNEPDPKLKKKLQPKMTEQRIAEFRDQALLSYELALVDWDIPLSGWTGFDCAVWNCAESDRLKDVYLRYGFTSLLPGGKQLPTPPPQAVVAQPTILVLPESPPTPKKPLGKAAGTEAFDMSTLSFDY